MPEYLAPGVYVEETQASNKPIEGVSTSTAGLVGVTERGPVNMPQLVTSVGEYRRLFGGNLPQDEFTDPSGRSHCYLPHAVEGFFVNGGKRAYVTRVLPDEAALAERNMFYVDLANVPAGDTVILRAALQDTGTAVNMPLLYVLDPANFAISDWVRVGTGSRADYRQVQSIGAAPIHTSLNFPLNFSHPGGAPTLQTTVASATTVTALAFSAAAAVGATTVVLDGAAADITDLLATMPSPLNPLVLQAEAGTVNEEYLVATGALGLSATQVQLTLAMPTAFAHAIAAPAAMVALTPMTLRESAAAGARQIIVTGPAAPIANLLAGMAQPANRQLLQVGPASAAEYAYATSAARLGTSAARLTLASPLRMAHAAGAATPVAGLRVRSGALVNLSTSASAGDLLVYGPNYTTVGDLVVIGVGSNAEEVQGIGQLAVLPLDTPTYAPYPAGTGGQRVTLSDDRRAVIDLPSNLVVPLDTVAGMAPGMLFTFGANSEIVSAVDPVLGLVRLAAPLAGPALAVTNAITVGTAAAAVVAFPTARVLPLNSVNGIDAGMTLALGPDTRTVGSVLGDLHMIALNAALPAVPAAGTAVTIGGNGFTVQHLLRADVVPLDDVTGLTPGMSLTVGPDTRTISAVNLSVGAVTLQSALPAAPAAGAAVTFALRRTTQATGPGSATLALDNRLGLDAGDVVRIGVAPNEEYLTIARVLGERGVSPDAGVVQLQHALAGSYPAATEVVRQEIVPDPTRQLAILVLAPGAGSEQVLVSDGTGYALGDVIRFITADGVNYLHRMDGAPAPANPRELELDNRLSFSHAGGQPVFERNLLFAVQALDAGSWGNRLMIAAGPESGPLAPNAAVLAANPPPGPGLFSSLHLATLTGIESGTILELLNPDGTPVGGAALLKARAIDRASRLVLLDPPGLQAVHMNAVNNALLLGLNARVRSREFSLTVYLRQRPDPAVPARSDNVLDQESFRQLSMDPRHSRYVERVIGVTFAPGGPNDDAGIPLRRWDRRSEGASNYIRVRDLEPVIASRQAIRIGPEGLTDLLPSGLVRAARLPMAGGDDAVTLMDDAMYAGADHNEPLLRTGLFTLKNPQNISLIAIPGQTTAALQMALIDQCEAERYRFAVLDGPAPDNDTLSDVQSQRSQYDSRYAAIYHPWLTIPDPYPASLATLRQYPIPPSGHVLGVYARVDETRGVHKAPANEVVRGITGLTRYFSKGEQDILNPYPTNINVVRDFRPNNRGIRIWGARCITSDSEYKYVNVRRLLIFLEDSIDRGMQWVVFEPNAEPLWGLVRRSISNYLTTVWSNGALEGATAEQGFFVKCDRTTMTRDDMDNGRLVVLIGVAPVKPAEFVIIRIGLWTADAES